jgi:plastocyanin
MENRKMRVGVWVSRLAIAAALATTPACGGSSPTAPDPGPGGSTGGGGAVPDTATITISSAGVASPPAVTIRQGGRVTFVNNDSRAHDMASDPHPSHEDCPAIDQAGFLSPGQSRTTGNLNVVRTCGFHDHNAPGNTGLQGRITIVAAS